MSYYNFILKAPINFNPRFHKTSPKMSKRIFIFYLKHKDPKKNLLNCEDFQIHYQSQKQG